MGTTVLSPRDCLPASYDPFSYQISEMIHSSSVSRSRRGAFQASVVQRVLPSLASDHVSRGVRGTAAGDGDLRRSPAGLLPAPVPTPVNLAYPRHSSQKRSSSAFSSYVSVSVGQASAPPPSAPVRDHASSSSSPLKGRVSTARAASAGLISRGLGRKDLDLREGRFPLKVVRSNGVLNDNVPSRFWDAKSLAKPVPASGSEDAGDGRKRTCLDFSPRRVLVHDSSKSSVEETRTHGQRRESPASSVGKGRHAAEKIVKNVSTPPVTILQRPKSKEAASELAAVFFGGASSLTSGISASKSGDFFTSKQVPNTASDALEPELSSAGNCGEELIDIYCKLYSLDSGKDDFTETSKNDQVMNRESSRVTKCRNQVSADTQFINLLAGRPYSGSIESPICRTEMEVEKWISTVGVERWAGPAYSNSPPPSSLPLPKFSTKLVKASPSGSSADDLQFGGAISDGSAGKSSAAHSSPLLRSWMPMHQPERSRDIAFATVSLRRILNLDCC